jgi:hypothetical protein
MQTLWVTADADGHAAKTRIPGLRNDERLDIESTTGEDGTNATKDAWLIVHHHAERVDVDDIRLRSGFDVGGGGDAFGHKN